MTVIYFALPLLAMAPSSTAADAFWAAAEASSGAERAACLRAWALVAEPREGEALPKEAVEARRRAEASGGAQILSTLDGDRLEVRLRDPEHVLGRVSAELLTDGPSPILLRRTVDGRFALPTARPLRVRLSAYAVQCRSDVAVLRRELSLGRETAPPPPPDPTRMAAPLASMAPEEPGSNPAVDRSPEWWWYALLGVAAAGVGWAVVEEAR